MKTDVLPASPEAIQLAAALLRAGSLVAFPTETVYGLGANALSTNACAAIYSVKGRPSRNPIIVHLQDKEQALELVSFWPADAETLASMFWPGPLTLVLPRNDKVSDIVTGGGSSVGLRVPAHPAALALLRAASLPIAAPSANLSNHLSPTTAEHVYEDLGGRIPLILDAGPSPCGIESTVLSLASSQPTILRPGMISQEEIEGLIGPILIRSSSSTDTEPLQSPGQMPRHYAPRAILELWDDSLERACSLLGSGERVGCLRLHVQTLPYEIVTVTMPGDAGKYSARLYAELHNLDRLEVTRILVDMPPCTQEWAAVRDRLERAAARD